VSVSDVSKALKNPLAVSGERVGDFRFCNRRQPCSPRMAVVIVTIITRMLTAARIALVFVIACVETTI